MAKESNADLRAQIQLLRQSRATDGIVSVANHFIQRPDTRLDRGSGHGAPSYKSCRSQLRPATFLAVFRVIDFIKWSGLCFIAYCMYASIAVLAGKTTIANVGMNVLADVRVSEQGC
jgi:hypothetical protein